MSLLAPDVRLVGDSGGLSKAPLRVLESADKVGRFLAGVAGRASPTRRSASWSSTAAPALLVLSGGKPDSVFQLDVVDGRIQCVYIMRNPEKLLSLADGSRLRHRAARAPTAPVPPDGGFRRCVANIAAARTPL